MLRSLLRLHSCLVRQTITMSTTSAPAPRQRLKGIKKSRSWWNAYHQGRVIQVKRYHSPYFIIAQYFPNETISTRKQRRQETPTNAEQPVITCDQSAFLTPVIPVIPVTPVTPVTPLTLSATNPTDFPQRDLNNPYGDLIMGFLTSIRQFGSRAVDRNRARRRMTAAARLVFLHQLDTRYWYVVACKTSLNEASYDQLCASLNDAKKYLNNKTGRRSNDQTDHHSTM